MKPKTKPVLDKQKTLIYEKQIHPLVEKLMQVCDENHITMVGTFCWDLPDGTSENRVAVNLYQDTAVPVHLAVHCLEQDWDVVAKTVDAIRLRLKEPGFVPGPLDEIGP